MCDGDRDETFEAWDARMQADSHGWAPRTSAFDWVTDGHGHFVDPKVDEMDEVAQRMLASRTK
jgi:hypothetical protein